MRLQSLRQASSNRRKAIAVLAFLTPTVAWSEGFTEPLRAGNERTRSDTQEVQTDRVDGAEATALVPLPAELSGPYGAPMSLVGPVSRSAGQQNSPLQDRSDADDQWQPRGSLGTSPLQPQAGVGPRKSGDGSATPRGHLSTFQILPPASDAVPLSPLGLDAPLNDAAAAVASTAGDAVQRRQEQDAGDDLQPPLDVTDPEQNEPDASTEPDADGIELSEPGDTAGDSHVIQDDLDPDDQEDTRVEIRRLQLHDPAGGDKPASITARAVGNRSSARMTVGDVPLDEEIEIDREAALADTPAAKRGVLATDHGIQGDRITAAGELILASGKSAAGLPVLPQTAPLKTTIQRGLQYYWERPEDAAERTHWGMMHSIMIFDKDTQIIHRRQRYNAVAWMAGNNPCRNQLLFTEDQQGIAVRTGVGLQGHQAQLLAIFALVNVPLDYPVYAARQKYAVSDILQREMLDCKSGNELTFTLIALAHYADSDTSWIAADRQHWDVQRVIREELSQPIVGAACGGTHRLMGFAHALRRRHAEGKPIHGQWDRADRYVKEFVDYTWTLQNRDGSMSTAWFERPEDNGNMDRKIQTTGHMLEFLLSTVPDAELQSPRMLRTVSYLANTLYAERGHQWQVGPKGHALRSLAMYHQRVFGEAAPWRSQSGGQSAAGPAARRSVR